MSRRGIRERFRDWLRHWRDVRAKHLVFCFSTRSSPNRIQCLSELKRRNVYKVAVAYAGVGWLTIQAASIFLPAFNAPQWAMKILVVVIIPGPSGGDFLVRV